MTPRQECLALVTEHGADLLGDPTARVFDVNLWSPPGRVWVATDCHSLTMRSYTDRPAAWRSLLTDLRQGTRPCDAADCEGCEP